MEQIFQITLCISSLTEYGPGSTQQCVTAMELWSLFHLNSSLFSLLPSSLSTQAAGSLLFKSWIALSNG